MTLDINDVQRMFSEMENEYMSAQQPTDVELTTYLAPMRGSFSKQENRRRYLDGKTILNSHPITAADKCAAGFSSYLSDSTKTWFAAKMLNGDPESKDASEWLAKLSTDMRLIFANSNIYSELTNMYKEFNVYGRGCFLIARDFNDVVRAYSFTAGSYWLGRDATGRINSFGCKQRKRVNQLVSEFGYENCTVSIRNEYDRKNFSTYFTYNWLIYRSKEFGDTPMAKDKPYRSIKWLQPDNDSILEDKGHDYFPLVCAIASPIDNTQIYAGEYPGVFCLPEAKELQALQRDLNTINAFNAKPPMVAHGIADFSRMVPGGVIAFDAGMAAAGGNHMGMVPAIPFRDPTSLRDEIALKKQVIDSIFYVDLFQLLKSLGPNRMTAYEVNRRYSEMIEAVGPVVMALQSALQQLLDATLNILMTTMVNKDGRLVSLVESRIGPIPKELQGTELQFKFVGILSMLQKSSEMLPMEQLVQFLTYLRSSTQGEGDYPMDWIDIDDIVKKCAANLGAEEYLKGKAQVEAFRKLKQQAMAEQQQQQDAMTSIQAAATLSQTPMGQQTAQGAVQGNPVQ